eukprot:TRINITY_DN465_c2_g1_i2.p1 TRINITY_DN465_c2_g1~~TRINITY_DN465_c2_g1_i2.p1  ORF type:complete len:245 (+),score=83.05 TRINITY_DN465_c2_g1_i2:147-881(+)
MVGRFESWVFSSRGMSYILGGTMVAYSGWGTTCFYYSKYWPRVDGHILGMYPYRAWIGDDKLRYYIDYEFEHNGEKRYGVQVETGTLWSWWMGDMFRDTVGSNEIRRGRLRPGSPVKVFVNPDNPKQCALFRTADPTRNGALMGTGATLILGAFLTLPRNHRFEIVNKIRWFFRYRMMMNAKKTRVIDVVFDRADHIEPAWKKPDYQPNPAVRDRLGLDSEQWDKDVQQKRLDRLKKEAEEKRE